MIKREGWLCTSVFTRLVSALNAFIGALVLWAKAILQEFSYRDWLQSLYLEFIAGNALV